MTVLSNKIAAIGKKDLIWVMSAVGADTFFTDDQSANEVLSKIKNDYALIVTTDRITAPDNGKNPYPIILQLKEII